MSTVAVLDFRPVKIVSTMLFLVGALDSETLLLLLAASASFWNARG